MTVVELAVTSTAVIFGFEHDAYDGADAVEGIGVLHVHVVNERLEPTGVVNPVTVS